MRDSILDVSTNHLFDKLLSYFQSQADKLGTVVEGTKMFSNRGDAGSAREDALVKFLDAHVPKRCSIIKGGFVFDSLGHESKQIDIIVTTDATLQFKDESTSKSFNAVEGCNTIISVKTFLDKDSLIDALENLVSVPPISNIKLIPHPEVPDWVKHQLPQKIIFAYGGLTSKTIYDHMKEYATENELPPWQIPDMVIVNNEYYIERIGKKGTTTIDGTLLPPNSVGRWVKENNRYLGALALVHLLVRIQHMSTFSPFLEINWEQYLLGMAVASSKNTSK